MPNNNQLVVPGVQQALDQMKYEIATEFGVQLGAIHITCKRFCRWRNHKAPCTNGRITTWW